MTEEQERQLLDYGSWLCQHIQEAEVNHCSLPGLASNSQMELLATLKVSR